MVVLVNGAFRLDPKWKNIRESKTMYVLSRWFVVILAIVVQGIILANAMGVLLDVARAISVFLAMFFSFWVFIFRNAGPTILWGSVFPGRCMTKKTGG